jgi:hypothetical protein
VRTIRGIAGECKQVVATSSEHRTAANVVKHEVGIRRGLVGCWPLVPVLEPEEERSRLVNPLATFRAPLVRRVATAHSLIGQSDHRHSRALCVALLMEDRAVEPIDVRIEKQLEFRPPAEQAV